MQLCGAYKRLRAQGTLAAPCKERKCTLWHDKAHDVENAKDLPQGKSIKPYNVCSQTDHSVSASSIRLSHSHTKLIDDGAP